MTGQPLRVGVSAVFDPAVTPHARTFLRALSVARNHLSGLDSLRWHWLDDGADPQRGATVAQQMIDWGADLVIGHFSSDAALAAAPLYHAAGIALLTPAATIDCLTLHDNVLRFCVADRQLAADLLGWLRQRRWQRLCVGADASAHGQALAAAIRAGAAGQGLTLVSTPEQADVEVFAGRLKPSREHWQARLRAASRRPLVLTDDAASPHLLQAGAHAGRSAMPAEPMDTYVIGFDDGPGDCPVAEQHRRLFGDPPQTYYRESLRLLHVLAAVAQRHWPGRTALLDALRHGRFATPLGPVRFARGECQGLSTRLWQVGAQGLMPLAC